MSRSRSNRSLNTFSKQKEGGKIRRIQKQEYRRQQFELHRATIRQEIINTTPFQWVMAFLVGMMAFTAGAIMMFYKIRG